MKKATLTPNLFTTILMACMAVTLATTTVEAGTKVTICHIPPGNPSNFHTITVNENAVQAHLAHGDLLGACGENCEFLCDDANPCTIDATGN